MTAPGQYTTERDASGVTGASTSTGRHMIVAEAYRGPLATDPLKPLRNMSEVNAIFGTAEEATYSYLHDEAESFFATGGAELDVARTVASTATPAAATIGGNRLVITASSPGAWGNDRQVAVLAGVTSGTFILVVSTLAGEIIERSRELTDQLDAQAWAEEFARDIIVDPGTVSGDPPPASAVALTGGADNRNAINTAAWNAATDRLGPDRGPGQPSIPGIYTPAVLAHACDRALDYNRCPILDLQRGLDVAGIKAAAAALQSATEGGRRAILLAQSGVARARRGGKGKRTIPASSAIAGLCAAYDATGDVGDPIANVHGRIPFFTGVDRTFTATERDELNKAGVTVLEVLRGVVTVYSNRSAAKAELEDVDFEWSAARTTMALRAEAAVTLEEYVLRKIDGRGTREAQCYAALRGICKDLFDKGALYGRTLDEACSVDVEYHVSTRKLAAVIEHTPSPSSQTVTLELGRRAPTA